MRAVQCYLAVHVALLPGRIDRAKGRKHSVCHDFAKRDGGAMFGDRVVVVHAGQDLVGSQEVFLGEVTLLAVDRDVVIVLDQLGIHPWRKHLGHCVGCRG